MTPTLLVSSGAYSLVCQRGSSPSGALGQKQLQSREMNAIRFWIRPLGEIKAQKYLVVNSFFFTALKMVCILQFM